MILKSGFDCEHHIPLVSFHCQINCQLRVWLRCCLDMECGHFCAWNQPKKKYSCLKKTICKIEYRAKTRVFFGYSFCMLVLYLSLPKTNNERLMLLASMRVSPLLLVLFVFSEPARSTRHNRPSLLMYPFYKEKTVIIITWVKPWAPQNHFL